MSTVVIELLVGMIASGKSTYARQRADAGAGALVICHDDLTEMLHARYRYELGLRDCYRQMEDSLAHHALTWGRDVVIDRTHLTRESRNRWVSVAGILGVPIVAVVFPIESAAVHASRRFVSDARGRSYSEWLDVARHHSAQAAAEPIDAAEGFVEIRRMPAPTAVEPRLVSDPDGSEDSPVIRGTWVTVRHIVSLIVDGWSWSDILRTHPEMTEDDIRACLEYTVAKEGG
jgi:uncharacterized protein (DUF433 family)/predicted kinase